MDEKYKQNSVTPNDPNFVYDKRQTFKRDEKELVEDSWDEDEDDYNF